MPFSFFNTTKKYSIKTDRDTARDSIKRDSGIDADYFSIDESDYCDKDSSSAEEPGSTQTTEYDHGKNVGFRHPLIDSSAEIRLLRIMKATKSVIEGHFKKVNVTDLATINYLALSYTWGSARTDQDVNCVNIGGQALYIRNNLWDFFVSNGEQCKGKYLFVDAICVDQLNWHERPNQVKLMAEVYSKADLVYVWLGKPLRSQHDNLKALRWRLSNPSTQEPWSRHAMFGLGYLCSSQYWKRLWIVQELLLARNILIVCGKWRFNFDELANLQRAPLAKSDLDVSKKLDWWDVWLFSRPESYSTQNDAELRISNGWEYGLRVLDHRGRWDRKMKLRARSTSGKSECYHPRDKIYALIGLLKDSEKRKITPSYQCTDQVVYAQALKVGLPSLQQDIEPKAPAAGYYPRDQYEEYASSLRNILGLARKDVAEATMNAFKSKDFEQNFYRHCKTENGHAWPKNKSPADIESSIFYDFLMLTKGKESAFKVFRLRLNIQGKAHLTSAALTAARSGFYEEKRFLKENEKQGYSFRMLYTVSKVWERTAHFRRWTPFGQSPKGLKPVVQNMIA